MSVSILVGGDLVPTESNFSLFEDGKVSELLGEELERLIYNVDFRIFNLETPLTDEITPIEKNGPCLAAHTKTINGIKKMQADLLCLANNHIMDQGTSGLNSTIETIEKFEIDYVGVGSNSDEAKKPYITELNGLKLGIYNCVEHEFSVVTSVSPGANPFDPLESFDSVQELKKECDAVLVLYHGGKEHYRYPSPYLQTVCHKFIEKGADAVICQHSHCIGCEEVFKGKTILYGQGNFIFDHSKSEFWKTSLLVKLKIDKDKIQMNYYPIVKNDECIRLANTEEHQRIIDQFEMRSDEIKNPSFVEMKYNEFAISMLPNYIDTFLGRKKLYKILAKLLGKNFYFKYYNRRTLLAIQNYMECEAHHELICSAIDSLNKR